MRRFEHWRLAALLLVLLPAAFWVGIQVGRGDVPAVARVAGVINKEGDALSSAVGQEPVDFMPFWRTWNTLENKFVPFGTSTAEEVKKEERIFKSIEGLVASYSDPYTVFMRPQVAEDFKIITKGSLEGIGAVITEQAGGIYVVAPVPGSPAERAGLLSGDHIMKIGGEETKGMSVDVAVGKIRGEAGTEVVLTIGREGKEPTDVPVVRGTIEIPSTRTALVTREVPKTPPVPAPESPVEPTGALPADAPAALPEPDVVPEETERKDFFVLQLFSFSETSIAAFRRELEAYIASDAESLIIDLRGNPGGYLEAAVDIASWFLPQGTPVVIEHIGPQRTERVHGANGHMLKDGEMPKIAILIDRGSASASEILAGALHDHSVATLIGERSFGKGSVQELVSITDTLSLKVTVARWVTPNGTSISNGGLTPDIVVDAATIAAATSSDPFVDAAIDFLVNGTSSPAHLE